MKSHSNRESWKSIARAKCNSYYVYVMVYAVIILILFKCKSYKMDPVFNCCWWMINKNDQFDHFLGLVNVQNEDFQ